MTLNNKNYKDYLKGISVIEFSGESCANCLTLMPILSRLVGNMRDVNLHHVEVDETTMDIVTKYEILTVPTILIMNDDKEVARCRGFQPEEILELWLDAKIQEIRNQK